MSGIVVALIVGVLSLGGALVWILMLLWAAREDGRDQAAYDREHGPPR